MRAAVAVTLLGLFIAASAGAQAPAQKPPASPPAAQPPAAQPAPSSAAPPPESYSYNPEGRRDPFLSLIGSGVGDQRTSGSRRTEGAAGMLLNEISVRGIVQSGGTLVAMVEGPDKKTYIVHAGDKLADGTIRSITPQGLVVIQEVNDPLSLVKQREVRKLLRSLEDAKE